MPVNPLLLQLANAMTRARSALHVFEEFDDLLRTNSAALTSEQLTLIGSTGEALAAEVGEIQDHINKLEAAQYRSTKVNQQSQRTATRDTRAYKPVERPLMLILERVQLTNHVPEAEVILRMGAFANALCAIVRRYPFGAKVPKVDRRDRMHLTIAAAAYIQESRRTMNQRHDGLAWQLVELGHAHGRPNPQKMPFSEIKALLAKGSQFGRRLETIRDKFAFHFDKDPFVKWLSAMGDYDAVVLYTLDSNQPADIVFEASAQAIDRAFKELQEPGFVRRVALIAAAMPHVVDGMIHGFFHKYGMEYGPVPGEMHFGPGSSNASGE